MGKAGMQSQEHQTKSTSGTFGSPEKRNHALAEQTVEMDSVETRMGKKTILLHHLTKKYQDKMLVNDFDYIVLRGQRLGIIGPNGCGKSTLIRMIAGVVQPDQGEVEVGETIRIGYFAQEVPDMDNNQRVIDYIRDVAEYIPTRDGKITASMMLERFLLVTPPCSILPSRNCPVVRKGVYIC